jgi:hypothetical protein
VATHFDGPFGCVAGLEVFARLVFFLVPINFRAKCRVINIHRPKIAESDTGFSPRLIYIKHCRGWWNNSCYESSLIGIASGAFMNFKKTTLFLKRVFVRLEFGSFPV